jgi:hypothetical protein
MNGGFKPFAPIITSVQCRTGGERPVFVFVWQPQHDYLGPFTVLVTDSAGSPIAGDTTARSSTGATWTATVTMDAATNAYYARASVDADPGEPAPALHL